MEKNAESEQTITVYGYPVNERFAHKAVDAFHPLLSRVIEEMVLQGKDEKQVVEAATTTAKAIVAGIRALTGANDKSRKLQDDIDIIEAKTLSKLITDQQGEWILRNPESLARELSGAFAVIRNRVSGAEFQTSNDPE